MPVSPLATTLTRARIARDVVLGEQPVGVGDEHPLAAVGVAGRHLHDRRTGRTRRGIDALEQLDLGGLGDGLGILLHVVDDTPLGRRQRSGADTATTTRRRLGRCGGRSGQAGLGQVARVCETGGLALDDPDADTPVATRGDLFDPTVVEADSCVPLVLGVDLCELCSGTKGGAQRPLDDVLVDHPASLRADRWWCRPVLVHPPSRCSPATPPVSVGRVNVAVGLTGEARLVVGEADTARALGSGDVDVLGTPRLVALFEEATCNALTGFLEPGQSTVGMRVQIDHLQPTPVGAEVTVEAYLDKIEGRRITFTVTASDSGGLIAAGKVTRVVIDVERFMAKCCHAD